MIKVNIYRNRENDVYRFTVSGHAGFAKEGSDIVCSAVSILVINTVNAIEQLVNEELVCDTDDKRDGFMNVIFPNIKEGIKNHDTSLLLEAMVMGLSDVEIEYSRYITLENNKEV